MEFTVQRFLSSERNPRGGYRMVSLKQIPFNSRPVLLKF